MHHLFCRTTCMTPQHAGGGGYSVIPQVNGGCRSSSPLCTYFISALSDTSKGKNPPCYVLVIQRKPLQPIIQQGLPKKIKKIVRSLLCVTMRRICGLGLKGTNVVPHLSTLLLPPPPYSNNSQSARVRSGSKRPEKKGRVIERKEGGEKGRRRTQFFDWGEKSLPSQT
jgi:hypothetical protein